MKVAPKSFIFENSGLVYNSKLSTIFGVAIQMCKNIILENFFSVFLFLLNQDFDSVDSEIVTNVEEKELQKGLTLTAAFSS